MEALSELFYFLELEACELRRSQTAATSQPLGEVRGQFNCKDIQVFTEFVQFEVNFAAMTRSLPFCLFH